MQTPGALDPAFRTPTMSLKDRIGRILGDGLFRGVSVSFGLRLVSMALLWLTAVLLGRMLGLANFGTYAFLTSLVAVLRLPATFGTPMLMVREVGAARATEDWGRMRGVATWALRFVLLTSIPIALAVAVALIFFPHLVPPHLHGALAWSVGLVVLAPMAAIRGGILRGLKQVVAGQLPEQLVQPLTMLLLLCIPLVMGLQAISPADAMAANVISTGAAWLVGGLILMRVWPRAARAATPVMDGKRWSRSLLPMGFGNAMYHLDGQVAVLVLGLVAANEQTGLFKAASQFALFAGLGYSVVNVNVSPRLAASFAKGDMARLQYTVTRGARLSLVYCLPAALGLSALGGWVLGLTMGAEFASAWLPLVILCLGHLVNAAFGSASALLNMTHHESRNTVGFGIGLAVNVALTLALSPTFGAPGAATAAAAGVIARNLYLWWIARRLTGLDTSVFGLPAKTV